MRLISPPAWATYGRRSAYVCIAPLWVNKAQPHTEMYNNQQPTTNNQQPTTNNQQPTTNN
jgi:hypothetical protein